MKKLTLAFAAALSIGLGGNALAEETCTQLATDKDTTLCYTAQGKTTSYGTVLTQKATLTETTTKDGKTTTVSGEGVVITDKASGAYKGHIMKHGQ